jgi:hypothetical protein
MVTASSHVPRSINSTYRPRPLWHFEGLDVVAHFPLFSSRHGTRGLKWRGVRRAGRGFRRDGRGLRRATRAIGRGSNLQSFATN